MKKLNLRKAVVHLIILLRKTLDERVLAQEISNLCADFTLIELINTELTIIFTKNFEMKYEY